MKRTSHAAVAVAVCPLALTVFLLPASGSAMAADAASVPTEGVRVSAAGPILATGTVTRDGRPVGDAQVVARIWPNGEQLEALHEGDTVDLRTVAKVRSDENGAFQITLDPAVVPATHKEGQGEVSVELQAIVDDGQQIGWQFTAAEPSAGARTGVASAKKWSIAADEGEAKPGEFRFDIGSSPSVLDVSNPSSDWVDEAGEKLSKGSAALIDGGALAVQPTAFCGGPLEAGPWRRNTREHFMNVYAWSGAMALVDQTLGAASSHTLGIAVRTPDGWSVSGTSTKSISEGAGQEVTGVADAGIWNSWNYRDFYGRTTAGPINCIKVVPVSIYDIFNEPYTYAPHQNFGHACVPKSRGATLRKNTAKNVTYATGVDIGPVSVSAQSGYNEGTEVRWGVTRNSWACSNNVNGWIAASQVDVRAR